MTPEVGAWTAEEIAAAVRRGDLSAVEAVSACLDRVRRTETRISAFLEVEAEEALQRARELDRLRKAGEAPGPLVGVAVALKDNLSRTGRSLTAGSRILESYVAPYTATAVQRLERAGAVVLGRANLDEFAMGSSCENSAFQITRNPWNLERVPGGSSGGSAAAVAAGGVPLALGSDTGGSIRQPAALCGVVGFKGTYGRVSRYGLVAFGSSLDQIGPLARNVRDAALCLQVISGADPRDPTAAARPVGRYLDGIEGGIDGTRVGIVEEVEAIGLPPPVAADFAASLARLRELGADPVRVAIPNLRAAVAAYYVLANCEASANLARFDGVRYGRRAVRAESLDELYTTSRSESFGAEVKRRIMLGTFALSAGYYDAYYARACAVVEAMRAQFTEAFRRVDLIVLPTTPGGAFALGERADDPLAMYLSDVFTTPASLCGLPAIALPSGLDGEGLPLSLQIVGRPFDEGRILRAARALERATGFRVTPALESA